MTDTNDVWVKQVGSLEDCYRYQLHFADFVSQELTGKNIRDLTEKERITATKEYALYTIAEIIETLGTMDWKNYRELGVETSREDLVDEIVDIHKFLWGLMATWNISLGEFVLQFRKKSEKVEQRWANEHDSN